MFYRNSRAENEKKTPKIFQKLFIEILVVSLCRVSQNFETVSESLELKYSLNILSRVTHDDSASIELALRTENEIEFESNLNVEPACRLLAFSFSQSLSLSFSLSLSRFVQFVCVEASCWGWLQELQQRNVIRSEAERLLDMKRAPKSCRRMR